MSCVVFSSLVLCCGSNGREEKRRKVDNKSTMRLRKSLNKLDYLCQASRMRISTYSELTSSWDPHLRPSTSSSFCSTLLDSQLESKPSERAGTSLTSSTLIHSMRCLKPLSWGRSLKPPQTPLKLLFSSLDGRSWKSMEAVVRLWPQDQLSDFACGSARAPPGWRRLSWRQRSQSGSRPLSFLFLLLFLSLWLIQQAKWDYFVTLASL